MEFKNLMKSAFLLLALCVGFTSCDDDNDKVEPEVPVVVAPETVEIKNAELKAVLKTKGFITFNKEGELVQNDTVLNLTTLDLSGSELTDISGLEVFPKLTEVNLSNNNFDVEFDFSVLPATIKGVDLTKNKIFYYHGLVSVKIEENGNQTVTTLRALTKLYLPEDAKFDLESVAPFYNENKATVDMKMENESGVLEAYTTLRDIPNPVLKGYMLSTFPSIFTADKTQVDISRPMTGGDVSQMFFFPPIDDLTGIEYVIRNTAWEGNMLNSYALEGSEHTPKISYIKIPPKVVSLMLVNIETPYGIDFSIAAKLKYIQLVNVKKLKKVDLSMSPVFGVEDLSIPVMIPIGTSLILADCELLEEVLLPEKENLAIGYFWLELLPKLRKLDLSRFVKIDDFRLGLLGEYDLVYPNIKYITGGGYGKTNMRFGCTTEIFEKPETKEFLDKYYWSKSEDDRKLFLGTPLFRPETEAINSNWRLKDPSSL